MCRRRKIPSRVSLTFPAARRTAKAPPPSTNDGLKPQAALPARAIGRMQRTASHTTRARRVPGDFPAAIPFPGCATHGKGFTSAHRRRFETARIVQSVGWVYHATSRIPRARRVPDDSPAMIPFPGCATRGKASRPSVEDGSKSCASSGGLNGCSAQPNVSLAPGAFRAVPLRRFSFPAARRTAKAPRPSIGDGLKPQAVLAAAADSARTGDWTDVPEA